MSSTTSANATSASSSDKANHASANAAPVNTPTSSSSQRDGEMLFLAVPQYQVALNTFILDIAGFTGRNSTAILFDELAEIQDVEITFADSTAHGGNVRARN